MTTMRTLPRRDARALPGNRLHAALWLAAGLLAAAVPASADVYNVDVNSDVGQDPATTTKCAIQGNTSHCSLRAAIAFGNTRSGSHTINIGVPTITVINGSLPQMRAPFTVNGNQATINGNGHGCLDLTDSGTAAIGHADGASGSKIFNLAIGNCSGAGISANGHDYWFSGNFIGVSQGGLVAMPNVGDGISISASHVYPDTSSNFLLNLYNGFPVQPVDPSQINAFTSNLATALASLDPVLITNNVISGNSQNGIEIFSQNLAAVFVVNNRIGTDFTGNLAIPNGANGIHLVGSTFGNMLGPGNVISGNNGNGIQVDAGAVFLPNFVMGNRIGLSLTTPGVHLGNKHSGIAVDTKPDTSVASFNPSGLSLVIGPGNVISDNEGANNNNFPDTLGADEAGILITGASNSVKVIGNTIGLAEFPAGTPSSSTDYGNAGDGIIVTTTGNSLIGNTIAANARHGIVVKGSGTNSTSIRGNYIGISPFFSGNFGLGNGVDGLHIDAASATTVGGAADADANFIAGNKRNGIKLRNGGDQNGWSNLFQRNRVYANAKALPGVDIDLEHSENAADSTHSEFPFNYANRDQSTPQICLGSEGSGPCVGATAPANAGANTVVKWTVQTHGPANFRAEFFAINASTLANATQMTFLGEQTMLTDATGKPFTSGACSGGRCTATLAPVPTGRRVVMTLTDVTPLTDTPAGGSDWKAQLKCFLGNNGIILPSCNVNDTSEYSAPIVILGGDVIFTGGFQP